MEKKLGAFGKYGFAGEILEDLGDRVVIDRSWLQPTARLATNIMLKSDNFYSMELSDEELKAHKKVMSQRNRNNIIKYEKG